MIKQKLYKKKRSYTVLQNIKYSKSRLNTFKVTQSDLETCNLALLHLYNF